MDLSRITMVEKQGDPNHEMFLHEYDSHQFHFGGMQGMDVGAISRIHGRRWGLRPVRFSSTSMFRSSPEGGSTSSRRRSMPAWKPPVGLDCVVPAPARVAHEAVPIRRIPRFLITVVEKRNHLCFRVHSLHVLLNSRWSTCSFNLRGASYLLVVSHLEMVSERKVPQHLMWKKKKISEKWIRRRVF